MKLKYKKFNNSDSIISIELHNGYTVIALTGFGKGNDIMQKDGVS